MYRVSHNIPYRWFLASYLFTFQIPQRMRLNKEQQIEIILRAGSRSNRMIANIFNGKHGTNITHDNVAKRIGKLRKTGIVTDQERCCRRRTASHKGTTARILAALTQSLTESVCRLCAESGISRILKADKWNPYNSTCA